MIKVNNTPKKRFFYSNNAKTNENKEFFEKFENRVIKYINEKKYEKLKRLKRVKLSKYFSFYIFDDAIKEKIKEVKNPIIRYELENLDWFKVLVGDIYEIKELIKKKKNILSDNATGITNFENYKNIFSSLYEKELSNKIELKKSFFKTLNLNVCPYCNRNFINPINKNQENKVSNANDNKSPDIEHFYPKSKYPFLSLSISNLLPSCAFCNSIKSNVDTYSQNCVSPYEERIKSMKFDFELGVNKIDNIKIKSNTNNSKVLNLEDFYNDGHKEYINDTYKNILKHPHIYKKYMLDDFGIEEERYKNFLEIILMKMIFTNIHYQN